MSEPLDEAPASGSKRVIARLRQTTGRWRVMVLLAFAAAAVGATLIAVWAVTSLTEEEGPAAGSENVSSLPAGEGAGSGGGGEPPQEFVAARDSLPLYPGATVDEPGGSTGSDIRTTYWVADEPEQVMAFYEPELSAQGWVPEGPVNAVVLDKAAGEQHLDRSFAKGDLRLVLSVNRTFKDPSRGKTYLTVDLRLRDDGVTSKKPPPELVAADNSLPLYPNAIVDRSLPSTGLDIGTSYWVADEPEQVMAFYERELSAQGWQPEGPVNAIVFDKATGERNLDRSFVKDDLRLMLSANRTLKDPSRGNTYLVVALIFRQ